MERHNQPYNLQFSKSGSLRINGPTWGEYTPEILPLPPRSPHSLLPQIQTQYAACLKSQGFLLSLQLRQRLSAVSLSIIPKRSLIAISMLYLGRGVRVRQQSSAEPHFAVSRVESHLKVAPPRGSADPRSCHFWLSGHVNFLFSCCECRAFQGFSFQTLEVSGFTASQMKEAFKCNPAWYFVSETLGVTWFFSSLKKKTVDFFFSQ